MSEPRTDLYHPVSWFALLWHVPIAAFGIVRRIIRQKLKQPRLTVSQTIISLVTIACLYFAVLVIPLYFRGKHTADDIVYARYGRLFNLTFVGGHVYFETASTWPGESPLVHFACTPDLAVNNWTSVSSFRHGFGGGEWGMFREAVWDQPLNFDMDAEWTHESSAYPFGRRTGSRAISCPGMAAGVSYSYLFILCLLFPAARGTKAVFQKLLRRRRIVRNVCPACTYDLRAHKPGEKCPECGQLIGSNLQA